MTPNLLPDSILDSYRREFPHVLQPHYYLNHAAFGVLSDRVNRHINRHLDERNHGVIESFMLDQDVIEETRNKIAQLINAPSADNIAFVTNTSEGLNLIAGGLPWKSGDSIVLNDIEFPSNVYPFTNLRSKGAKIRFLKSDNGMISADRIISQLTDTDKLVSVSAVQFLSGYRIDLKALGQACSKRGKWLIVDGIQAAGNSPVDVQEMNIDGFVAGGLKWLMAPMGIGFVYLSDALLDAIRPAYVGWLSVETPWNLFDYEQGLNPTARRFELGGLNVAGIYALHHALDPFLEIGTDRIQQHLLALTDQIVREVDIPGATLFTRGSHAERTGIVSFTLPESMNGDTLVENLRKQAVTVSHRTGKLRFSPHFYNNSDDITAAVSIINKTVRNFT